MSVGQDVHGVVLTAPPQHDADELVLFTNGGGNGDSSGGSHTLAMRVKQQQYRNAWLRLDWIGLRLADGSVDTWSLVLNTKEGAIDLDIEQYQLGSFGFQGLGQFGIWFRPDLTTAEVVRITVTNESGRELNLSGQLSVFRPVAFKPKPPAYVQVERVYPQ